MSWILSRPLASAGTSSAVRVSLKPMNARRPNLYTKPGSRVTFGYHSVTTELDANPKCYEPGEVRERSRDEFVARGLPAFARTSCYTASAAGQSYRWSTTMVRVSNGSRSTTI